ncbi:MAG: hypothetical protein ACI4WT_12215 [Oligosphaeraceae bacterium]
MTTSLASLLRPHSPLRRLALCAACLLASLLLTAAETTQPQTLSSGSCSVRFTQPPASSPLNEPFVIAIDATAELQATIDLDTANLEEHFTVTLRRDPPIPAKPSQPFSQHLELTLEPLWHGQLDIPEILVSFSFSGHPPVVIALPSATVNVPEPSDEERQRSVATAEATTPLEPPATPTQRHLRQALIALATIAALAILAAIARWLLKRWRHHRQHLLPPPPPPHTIAFRRLDDLLAQHLVPNGQFREFYNAISTILRDYIEQRFAIRAPEQTTEEFLAVLQREPERLAPAHHQLLQQFLAHTDLVKYARATPSPQEISQTIADTRAFITETIDTPIEAQTPTTHGDSAP